MLQLLRIEKNGAAAVVYADNMLLLQHAEATLWVSMIVEAFTASGSRQPKIHSILHLESLAFDSQKVPENDAELQYTAV